MIFEPAVVVLVAATAVLLWLTYMDARYFLLPNVGNAALAILGVVIQGLRVDWAYGPAVNAMLGFMLGGAVCGAGIFLFTRWFSLKWKGVEGIGLGDVKFAAAAGIWMGPAGIGLMVGFSAALLVLFGIAVIAVTRRPLKDFYLPFGAAACPVSIVLLWLEHAGKITF